MTATATSVIQQRNSDMVELLKPDFVTRSELTYLTAVDQYMRLPCLRYLGLGGLGSAGEWRDVSGNGMDLTYNGNPTMSYTTQGAPYFSYDGVGDYHTHADDAHFDITGTETTVRAARRGLTMGCWAYVDNLALGNSAPMAKYDGSTNNRSYAILVLNTGIVNFLMSANGIAAVIATGTVAITSATWHFIAVRFVASTSATIYTNDNIDTLAAGIPASLFNSAAIFEISGTNGGAANLFTGSISIPFVCACALSDTQITQLYQSSRGLFGV